MNNNNNAQDEERNQLIKRNDRRQNNKGRASDRRSRASHDTALLHGDSDGSEGENERQNFCSEFGIILVVALKYIWLILVTVFQFIGDILGICWYPCKERTRDCCECCV